jgi:AAA+ superfamily predicted ATPase
MLRAVFRVATILSTQRPCLLWLDEMDAICRDRSFGDNAVYIDIKTECKRPILFYLLVVEAY